MKFCHFNFEYSITKQMTIQVLSSKLRKELEPEMSPINFLNPNKKTP